MKAILICSMFLSAFVSIGQTPDLPIDSTTGKISYSEVVYLESPADKDELYSRAREWFAKAYNSSNTVIQMEDRHGGKIIGKPALEIFSKVMGSNISGGYIYYTVSIYLKDGRYKYEVTDFHHKGKAGQVHDHGACENMIGSTEKTWGRSHQKTFDQYLVQMDREILGLVENLKVAMAAPDRESLDEDW